MKIEDVKIEDAADANYVIRKFFNNQFTNMKMSQLEQLVLTVYNMGKENGAPSDSESPESDDAANESPESDDAADESLESDDAASENPFKINDRASAIEDIEIASSGEIIKADTVGTVNSVTGDKVSFLFESGEDGEMIEASVLFSKLLKIS